MKWKIENEGSFPVLRCDLEAGESVKAQAGTMLAMSDSMEIKGKVDGGIGKAIGRWFSGESFFMQHATAKKADGWIVFAPPKPGSITSVDVKEGQEIIVQKDGFIAGTQGVDVSTKVQGLIKGIFGGEGLFVIKISGKGQAFMETYGSIYTIDVKEGEDVTIDNGHLIAWESSLDYKITKGGAGVVSMVTGGEGFVCKFSGKGRVWVQTRNPRHFAHWFMQFLEKPKAQ